ncbi:MAG TPA: hypothetical protein VFW40_02240 [Capsulimonadaceae bacterium]|nr:hypothetical protein [Capsulimonadaceae bacterium]
MVLRARALNRRIQEHLCEEEQRPKDPYAQMAEIAKVQDALSRQKGDSWPKA